MVRVVSGSKGGLRLKTKDTEGTRATLEKVKEAMFDMIMNYTYGSSVLDLFSGNGSLGIEALSRGASYCAFNDKDRECNKIIKENLDFTGLSDKSTVFFNDYSECISKLCNLGKKFDIILLDPPYRKDLIVPSVTLAENKNIVSDNCIIIAEYASDETIPDQIGHFTCQKKKKYGNTCVSVFRNF